MEKLKNDVLNLLKKDGSITNDEIAKILKADRKKVAYVILFFKRRGCINCYKVNKKRRIDVLKDDFTLYERTKKTKIEITTILVLVTVLSYLKIFS